MVSPRRAPLIGRESELAELQRAVSHTRLTTVTGAGGSGKTRLALEVTDRLARNGANCVLVPLSSVTGEERLVAALLAALGVRERFGSSPTDVLFEQLAPRRLLLVLDNCEHLLAWLRPLLVQLMDAAPNLGVLATSREPLALEAEHVLRLNPLDPPEAGGSVSAVVRSDAGRLFVDRAAVSDPGFALTPRSAPLVAKLCRELDGLPLALVLAAGQLGTLSIEKIAEGLARRGRLSTATGVGDQDGHQSLRTSLDWSYNLLTDGQQALLRRVSIFSGGFTTTAAHAIAAPERSEEQVRQQLRALEAKGLVVCAASERRERWSLLWTVAEYAEKQLVDAGEDQQTADQHLEWFTTYAGHANALLGQWSAHALIDQESANIRGALDRALARDTRAAAAIAAGMMRHWILAEHYEEARAVCAQVLATDTADADRGSLALVHCGAGLVLMLGEDYEGAIASTQRGLTLAEDLENPRTTRDCLAMSSMVLIQTGVGVEEGLRNVERAVELARRVSDPAGLTYALVNLAVALMLCEQFDAAQSAYEEFLRVPVASGHPRLRTWAEQAAAWTQISVGSPAQALQHAEVALDLEGDWPSMTYFQIIGFRIHALARMGRTGEAIAEGEAAMRLASESGALQAVPAIALALTVAETMRGDVQAAAAHARTLLVMPQAHTLALARETLARSACERGDTAEAWEHAFELQALAQRSGSARQRAFADYITGCVAIETGETGEARDRLHAALASHEQLGSHRDAADVLDALALLDVLDGAVERGARLAGAAAAIRDGLGCIPPPGTVERMQAARAQSSAGGGPDGWDAAWAQGEDLTPTNAIAYARRRRGPRARPQTGWASLTPTELEVASLAAGGMTNPQIAARLFIGRGTVKMHLSRVYRKLGVNNRTELSVAMPSRTNAPESFEPENVRDRPR